MEDIRPTAKWANRMLRPLTSIYHRLEKHHEIVTSVLTSKAKEKSAAGLDANHTRLSAKGADAIGTEQGCSYPDDEEPNDPAWVPGKPEKRRIRHNYSSRGQKNGARARSRLSIQSPETQKVLPGAIEIATPLITGKAFGGWDGLSSASPLRVQLFQNVAARVENGEHRRASRTHNNSFPPYQGSWKEVLDQSRDPGFVAIAHLLDRVFLKFLRSTRVSPGGLSTGPQGSTERGARSLLSMAVRRFPEFVAEEQRIQDDSDEGCEVDMCDAYFTELEASYAPGGNGWQPLREAARAQGIYLVSGMIQREWITDLAACRLMEECLSQEEFDAFESLLSKYLTRVDMYPFPSAFDPPRASGHRDDPVHILGRYYSRSPGRRAYVFEELTKLLMRGAIPPEWMVTTLWKRCVDGAIKSLSTEDRDSAAARRLIDAVILTAAGVYVAITSKEPLLNQARLLPSVRPRDTRTSTSNTSALSRDQFSCPIPIQDALSNLVGSLITALCGMCITRSQSASADGRMAGMKIRHMINYLAFAVQRAVGLGPATHETDGPVFHPLRRGYVLLADCTLKCGPGITDQIIYHTETVTKQTIKSFFRALACRQDVVKELAKSVSQVFRYLGHWHTQGPARTPKEIRDKVSQLSQLASSPDISLLLGRVAADAAMELAEKTLDPDDHAWAVEVQEKAVSSQQKESSASPSSSPSSTRGSLKEKAGLYRWEDSIGEWVASTPATRFRPVIVDIATKHKVSMSGRSRTIACSTTSSSSASSICSEKTISSVTSSAPSILRKRACRSDDPSPRPFKKIYHTRSAERLSDKKTSNRMDIPDRPVSKASSEESESYHPPVTARTRTAVREVLQKSKMTAGGDIRTMNDPVGGVLPKIEVVIVNKKSLPRSSTALFKNYAEPAEPISRRTRRSSLIARTDTTRTLSRRRQSAAVVGVVTRRRTMISCSQDDSDDELSFL